jgi:hypothetical protein
VPDFNTTAIRSLWLEDEEEDEDGKTDTSGVPHITGLKTCSEPEEMNPRGIGRGAWPLNPVP